jgi:hypothetical protein
VTPRGMSRAAAKASPSAAAETTKATTKPDSVGSPDAPMWAPTMLALI